VASARERIGPGRGRVHHLGRRRATPAGRRPRASALVSATRGPHHNGASGMASPPQVQRRLARSTSAELYSESRNRVGNPATHRSGPGTTVPFDWQHHFQERTRSTEGKSIATAVFIAVAMIFNPHTYREESESPPRTGGVANARLGNTAQSGQSFGGPPKLDARAGVASDATRKIPSGPPPRRSHPAAASPASVRSSSCAVLCHVYGPSFAQAAVPSHQLERGQPRV